METGADVVAAPGVDLNDAAYSLAMAMAARRKEPDRIDLFRAIRPPPSLVPDVPPETGGRHGPGGCGRRRHPLERRLGPGE